MPHYEKDNLQNLIDKIKRQQETIEKGSVAASTQKEPPKQPDRPMTWEEIQVAEQKKKAK